MPSYIFRRLLLIIPTLLGIMTINFFIVQTSPGGPVEKMILQLNGEQNGAMERITGSNQGDMIHVQYSRLHS